MADKCDRCGGIWHGGSPCTSFTSKVVTPELIASYREIQKLGNFCGVGGSALGELLDEIERLRMAGRALIRAYVITLEAGRERILFHGGTCDSVEQMESGDPALRTAKAAFGIETIPKPEKCPDCGMAPAVDGMFHKQGCPQL